MNSIDDFDDLITTEEAFERAVGLVIAAAEHNGVDVRGSWVRRNGDGNGGDWEVVVYELEKNDD